MPVCYQIWLTIATWVLPDITLVKVKTCGVWEAGATTCDTRSFFIAFAAAIGQPVLALLALNQNRFCAILGAGQFFVLIAIFYFHQPETPTSFYRDAVYCECNESSQLTLDIVFHVFILIIDAFLERRDRQMFELREQLKKQFKETQRAQQKEKRASDLNKRFISYSTSSLSAQLASIDTQSFMKSESHSTQLCYRSKIWKPTTYSVISLNRRRNVS